MELIDPNKLGRWSCYNDPHYGWCVTVMHTSGKKTILAGIEEETAKIIAAAPNMLRFLYTQTRRGPIGPLYVDVDRLLSVNGLTLTPHVETSLPDLRATQPTKGTNER